MLKNKNILKSALIFIGFTILVAMINLNKSDFSYDPIWIFHMLQKIANGAVIYTDFNVIVGPIFFALRWISI